MATLYYVYADIESRGVACQLVHGEMSAEERIRSLQFFSEAGGVLLATTAVMTAGVSLREVTDLVLYDLPRNEMRLQQVLGRFDRFGRLRPLDLYVLSASNARDGLTFASLGNLRNILSSRAAGGSKK